MSEMPVFAHFIANEIDRWYPWHTLGNAQVSTLIRALLAAALLTPGHRTVAQSGPGVISGSVIDAFTELPLAGSTVILRLADEGTLVSTGATAPTILAVARQTITTDAGRYSFTGLAPARYELRAQRMGYFPATIVIELRGDAGSLVSMGLSVAAVRLQPVPVNADASIAFDASRGGASASTPGDARIRAARARQREYASTDVREITEADVLESGSLAETDILRALQRLPGVDTYGDHTAELWTRGGRWDQTRVYFDGVPLFAPIHTSSTDNTISGFGTDVIGAALLLPGVRPPSIGEGAAGVIDLRSRPAVPDGKVRGVAEMTLLSGRLALSRGSRDGRSGWSVAGRHAAEDLVRSTGGEGLLSRFARDYFDDVTGRWEGSLGGQTRIRFSGVFSRDARVSRAQNGSLDALNVASSSGAVAMLSQDVGHVRFSQRAGASAVDRVTQSRYTYLPFPPDTTRGDTAISRILHLSLAGKVEPLVRAETYTWSAGYELTHQRLRNLGFIRELVDSSVTEQRLERQALLPVLAIWGEYRWLPRQPLRVDAGLRAEGSRSTQGAPSVRPMPRLQIRVALDSATGLSAGVGRSYLYTQTTLGGTAATGLGARTQWRLADETTPAIRSDIVTVGAERWVGDAWLMSATAYARDDDGVLLRDPRDGFFSQDVRVSIGRTRARGLELSARRLAGRLTGAAAYTIASARSAALGMAFPADEERPRSVDATAVLRATPRLQLGASYTSMSGRRFTANYYYSQLDSTGHEIANTRAIGAHNALSAPLYQSLDLLVDWSGKAWGVSTGIFFQFRNVAGQAREPVYDQSLSPCPTAPPAPWNKCLYSGSDHGNRINPFTPMFGIRVAF